MRSKSQNELLLALVMRVAVLEAKLDEQIFDYCWKIICEEQETRRKCDGSLEERMKGGRDANDAA
jgi:hypothetical protein